MKEEFIPYEQALALKELGFNKPCLAIYHDKKLKLCCTVWDKGDTNFLKITNSEYCDVNDPECSAPLYQQAFEWVRDNHKLDGSIVSWKAGIEVIYYFSYQPLGQPTLCRCTDDVTFKSYGGAELACLKKLIEIIKSKTNGKTNKDS